MCNDWQLEKEESAPRSHFVANYPNSFQVAVPEEGTMGHLANYGLFLLL